MELVYEAHLKLLLSRINDDALCNYASQLNGGRKCRVEHTTRIYGSVKGGPYYDACIRFDDDSEWLFQVRWPGYDATAADDSPKLDQEVMSEYATLKFLETTAVPAPRVFGYGLRSGGPGADHGVGVSFLLLESLESQGKRWYGGNEPPEDEETKRKEANLFRNLADILAELARHPFPQAGDLSLGEAPEKGEIQVSALTNDRFTVLDPNGPFETSLDYYTAWAEQYLALIADGQLYSGFPVNAYLAYRFLKDNAPRLAKHEGEGKRPAQEQFFLKHADDNGQHLLIDDDYNITGVVDWQHARLVPPREAFGASLVTVVLKELVHGGKSSLSVRDKLLAEALEKRGSPELARLMRDERARTFFWGLGLEATWEEARPAAEAILDAFGVKHGWDEWKEKAIKEYAKTDKRLRRLMRLEKARAVRSSAYHFRDVKGRQGS